MEDERIGVSLGAWVGVEAGTSTQDSPYSSRGALFRRQLSTSGVSRNPRDVKCSCQADPRNDVRRRREVHRYLAAGAPLRRE